jgi:hypothetical protein
MLLAVLASSFLLYAVGLGQGAIPVAGAVNWVLKDGLGQVGTLRATDSHLCLSTNAAKHLGDGRRNVVCSRKGCVLPIELSVTMEYVI